MSRGLSKQQRRILAMLETKELVNDPRRWGKDRGYFSTQEIVTELSIDYKIWLATVRRVRNPWVSTKREHIDYQKYDKVRMSIYRALRSLEKRGLIVSFRHWNERFWAIPERLKKKGFCSLAWARNDEERETRGRSWRWGAFIRTLPKDLHLKYKLRIVTKEDVESIKKLWKKYRISSVARV